MAPPAAVPVFFATPDDFRAWLAEHGTQASELLVGYHKVGSGIPSITWPQSVDEALCVGWIDGVRKRIDDVAYQIRFTPRRPGSIWSAVNVARMAMLQAEGRVQPAGLAAFERRSEARTRIYSYERDDRPELTPEEVARFQSQTQAWAFFQASPPGSRRTVLHWVTGARQPSTRARRLATLIEASAQGKRLR